jgi:hypothetical protein
MIPNELNASAPKGFKLKTIQGKVCVWDLIRKKYVVLTPEEGVRQDLVRFLIEELKVPAGLIAVERQLMINGLVKRFDIMVADRNGHPLLLVECKAPNILLNALVLEQLSSYNLAIKAPFLLVTNGQQRWACSIDFQTKKFQFLQQLVAYPFEG